MSVTLNDTMHHFTRWNVCWCLSLLRWILLLPPSNFFTFLIYIYKASNKKGMTGQWCWSNKDQRSWPRFIETCVPHHAVVMRTVIIATIGTTYGTDDADGHRDDHKLLTDFIPPIHRPTRSDHNPSLYSWFFTSFFSTAFCVAISI